MVFEVWFLANHAFCADLEEEKQKRCLSLSKRHCIKNIEKIKNERLDGISKEREISGRKKV